MAEFKNQVIPTRTSKEGSGDGFDAFGKAVPLHRRTAALHHMRAMGVSNVEDCWDCIGKMCEAIKRDEPYQAMAAGMQRVDLTGTYRLLAVLLTAKEAAS